jgi:hypothetical protein
MAILIAQLFALGGQAGAAGGPPSLTGFSYINGPFARVGWANQAIATVTLSAPAEGDTTVTVTSSDPTVATTANTTVPNGQSTATAPITGFNAGFTKLTATLGADSLSPSPDLEVGGPGRVPALSGVSVQPASVQPGQSSTGTVTLDFLAPGTGTTVDLASADPKVHVPATVVVQADQFQVTFQATTDSDAAGSDLITASLTGVDKQTTLTVADTIAPETTLVSADVMRAKQRAKFRFSSEADATFFCKIDAKAFAACGSPKTYRGLKAGKHTFQVRSRDSAGNVDTTPVKKKFRI